VALLLVVKLDATSSNPALTGAVIPSDAKFKAQSYIDLLAHWKIKDQYSFRAGVNNVFDNDPPLTGQPTARRALQPERLCAGLRRLGRYFFIGLTADF
jgi:outer membrane receptor protein involved in Fe transport